MKIGKKLVTTLLGFSTVGGVAAVASFGLTNCGEAQALENIIRDADVGTIGGGQIPSDEQIWEWIVDSNPNITSTSLSLKRVNISNKTLFECDVTAKAHSGFTGAVHVTYNTLDPKLTEWISGSQFYDTKMNLTSRYAGKAIISTGSTHYVHNYSFAFVTDAALLIDTPNMGGPATGFHFANLDIMHDETNAHWRIDANKCLRCDSSQFGTEVIKFDICNDTDNLRVFSMILTLTYQF